MIRLFFPFGATSGAAVAAQPLRGRRIRGRRILDVSEIPADNTVSDEIDQLLELQTKEPFSLLSVAPEVDYGPVEAAAMRVRAEKRKRQEIDVAKLLFDLL